MSESTDTTLEGGCLCGAFRFELAGPVAIVNLCHCSRCRKRSGSAFAAIVHADYSDFKILQGEDSIQLFEPDGWNARRFCSGCGSPLPGWDEEDNHIGIPAGLFDNLSTPPALQIMTDSKPEWSKLRDDLPSHGEFPEDW